MNDADLRRRLIPSVLLLVAMFVISRAAGGDAPGFLLVLTLIGFVVATIWFLALLLLYLRQRR